MLGYAILQMRMPPSSILFTQAALHAAAACVGCNCACVPRRSGRFRLREEGVAEAVEES